MQLGSRLTAASVGSSMSASVQSLNEEKWSKPAEETKSLNPSLLHVKGTFQDCGKHANISLPEVKSEDQYHFVHPSTLLQDKTNVLIIEFQRR